MKKYAKIISEETKQCDVAFGTYIPDGFTEMDVEQAWNWNWYVAGYVPEKTAPTKEEISALRDREYTLYVDKITCHINRLKDEEQTPEIIAEIEALKQERTAKVEEIKQKYPYPEE